MKYGLIPSPRGHQILDYVDRLNSTSRAYAHAIQCCGSTGKIETSWQRPALKQSIDETGMKSISRSGGVHGGDLIGAGVMELLAVPCKHSVLPKRCSSEGTSIAAVHQRQGLLQIVLAEQPCRNVSADDRKIDILQQPFHAGIGIIQVCDHRNARL